MRVHHGGTAKRVLQELPQELHPLYIYHEEILPRSGGRLDPGVRRSCLLAVLSRAQRMGRMEGKNKKNGEGKREEIVDGGGS